MYYYLTKKLIGSTVCVTDAAHCYNAYILSLQGVARFYKRNKKHVITTQTVSVKDCKF